MNSGILTPFLALLSGILLEAWEIFVEAAPYLMFGFGVAGLLNVLVPDRKIVEYLGSSAGKVRSVINASLAGLPLPLCSCGVIPAAMSIRKRGANRGATLSFLISTPQTGVDSIAITYALLDPLMTVFRPLATLATAVLAGLADNLLIGEGPEKQNQGSPGKKGGASAAGTLQGVASTVQTSVPISFPAPVTTHEAHSSCGPACGCSTPETPGPEKTETLKTLPLTRPSAEKVRPLTLSTHSKENEAPSCGCSCGCGGDESKKDNGSGKTGKGKKTVSNRILEGIKYAYVELLGDISKWVLIGILVAGIISYAVPETLVRDYLGGGLSSMLVMLVVGIPLYICATASTPLAATLVAKGMSPGTAFVFLLAGPATNAATITMVARYLGKRSAALYLGVIALCALGAGVLLDFLYLKLGISATATLGSAGEMLPDTVKLGFAALLLPLMLYGILHQEKECGCH